MVVTTLPSANDLPPELVSGPYWVTWAPNPEGKKVPYAPHGGHGASSTDPTDWATFDDARRAALRRPGHALGRVFVGGQGVWGLDLDNCLDDLGNLASWAEPYVAALGQTYVEISPSGRGLKAWLRGDLPHSIRHPHPEGGPKAKVEAYARERYFAVTGLIWKTYPLTLGSGAGLLALLTERGLLRDPEAATDQAPASRPAPAPAQPRTGRAALRRTTYGDAALGRAVDDLRNAPQGARNDTLNSVAYSLGRLVAKGDILDEGQVSGALFDAALAIGLGRGEIVKTINSGLNAGVRAGPPPDLPDFDAPDPEGGQGGVVPQRVGAGARANGNGVHAVEIDLLTARPRLPYAERLVGATVGADGEITTDPTVAARAVAWGREGIHTTDLGNALRLCRAYGDRIRYVTTWEKWLIYSGGRWEIDETGAIHRMARMTVREIYAEAAAIEDTEARRAMAKWATTSESTGKLGAMVAEARWEDGIATHHTALDRDPWLLNCANGTLDLRTGALRPHDRGDLLTRRIPVAYDPQATAPSWAAFIDRVTEGDRDLASYLARAVGYTLSGSTREQCLFFLYGGGSNGKSTFIRTLTALLGDYYRQSPTDMILLGPNGVAGIPNDLARLPGVRMTCTGEIGQGRRLDEGKVKDMTGGDVIPARFMRAEFFEFTPAFKLWLYGNHRPRITGDDHGIWRRIRQIPFEATITEAEKDPDLPDRLAAELPGILAWAVRGCLDWQREGLGTCEAVTRATERYRAEQDTVGAFMAERCELHPQAWVKARELYQAYQRWAEGGGERPLSIREFDAKLDARGYPSTRRSSGNIRRGIGLIDPNDQPLDDDPPPPAPPAPTPTPPTRAEVARGGDPPPAPEAGRIALLDWAFAQLRPHGGRAELGEGSAYVVTIPDLPDRPLASREELITYVTTLPRA